MNIFEAIFLGIVQGVTEFLPISSSAHTVLIQKLFQINTPSLMFNVSLHVGTLIAVLLVLRREILLLVQTLFNLSETIKKYGNLKNSYAQNKGVKLLALLIIGTIPTAIVGFILRQFYEVFLNSMTCTGFMFLLSGSFLWLTKDISNNSSKSILETKIKDSIIIGIMQGIAVIPGISRSGITISASLIMGVNHELAGRFSFLLSIPAIFGAFILSLFSLQDFQTLAINPKLIIIGTVASTFVGYMTLKLILHITKSGYVYIFTPYCYLAGILLMIAV